LKIKILKEGEFFSFLNKSYPKKKFFILFFITFAISFFISHQYKEKLLLQVFCGGGSNKKLKKLNLFVFFN